MVVDEGKQKLAERMRKDMYTNHVRRQQSKNHKPSEPSSHHIFNLTETLYSYGLTNVYLPEASMYV